MGGRKTMDLQATSNIIYTWLSSIIKGNILAPNPPLANTHTLAAFSHFHFFPQHSPSNVTLLSEFKEETGQQGTGWNYHGSMTDTRMIAQAPSVLLGVKTELCKWRGKSLFTLWKRGCLQKKVVLSLTKLVICRFAKLGRKTHRAYRYLYI